jgi:hypothetical protein
MIRLQSAPRYVIDRAEPTILNTLIAMGGCADSSRTERAPQLLHYLPDHVRICEPRKDIVTCCVRAQGGYTLGGTTSETSPVRV